MPHSEDWVTPLRSWLEGETEILDFDGRPIPPRLAEVLEVYRASFRRDSQMRRFVLERHHDVSGVSGTGTVAEGVAFSDGTAAVHWFGEHASHVIWPSIHDVEVIHGHGGATLIEWLD